MNYLTKFIHYTRHALVSFRFSILSIFITLFVIACGILILVGYKNSSLDIIYTANQSMRNITQSLDRVFMSEINLIERDASVSAALIKRKILNLNNPREMSNYFYILTEYFKMAHEIYWSDTQGNYISAIYNNDDTITTYYGNATVSPTQETATYHDLNGNVTKKTTLPSEYDPRTRPWFQMAASKGIPIWTEVYLFKPFEYLGITLATPIYEKQQLKGVLGVDLRLDWISWYINRLTTSPNGVIFIIQSDGKLIGHSQYAKIERQTALVDIHSLPERWIANSFETYKKTGNSSFSFSYEEQTYLAQYVPISIDISNKWYIGVVVPESDFIEHLDKARTISVLVSLLIMITGILLITKLINNVITPLKSVIQEADKIKNFELDDSTRVSSRIKEIILLSDAMHTMKKGLQAFKQYVPSELVRQLIKKGENAKLGGTPQSIVALFSDIEDFTVISHHVNADELLVQLNEYFEMLTRIILDKKGTIDKYIGDSIMAFWGAPEYIEKPCHHAAKAALEFMTKLKLRNEQWEHEGKPPFYTRIGIHYGDAIVGNLGSSERINYTAIGDTINITSRLEAIGKELKAQIIISDVVFEQIKDEFICNKIGLVNLKGIDEPILIYELIGHKQPSRCPQPGFS